MRRRRFRPAFESLDLRITPSDGLVPVYTSLNGGQSSCPGSFPGTVGEPGMDIDPIVPYSSGTGSDYNPLDPPISM